MKKFTCNCIDAQFKIPDQIFVDLDGPYLAEIPCVYRPNGKVTLRKIKLKTNYCPTCGAKMEEI